MSTRRRRVLVCGAGRLARALADAGDEVVYTDADQPPDVIAATAVQEDVDAVAIAACAHASVTAALAARGADDVAVISTEGA